MFGNYTNKSGLYDPLFVKASLQSMFLSCYKIFPDSIFVLSTQQAMDSNNEKCRGNNYTRRPLSSPLFVSIKIPSKQSFYSNLHTTPTLWSTIVLTLQSKIIYDHFIINRMDPNSRKYDKVCSENFYLPSFFKRMARSEI